MRISFFSLLSLLQSNSLTASNFKSASVGGPSALVGLPTGDGGLTAAGDGGLTPAGDGGLTAAAAAGGDADADVRLTAAAAAAGDVDADVGLTAAAGDAVADTDLIFASSGYSGGLSAGRFGAPGLSDSGPMPPINLGAGRK